MKNRVQLIDEASFELEKNIYITKLLEKFDSVKNLAVRLAKEIAVNKQSFSLNSELLNVSMMSNDDATELLGNIIDMNKATVCYLGLSIDDNEIKNIINN